MSDIPYTVGKVEFSPTPTDRFYIEDEDPGICTACGLKMTPVRPGKTQCDYCELGEAYDKAQDEIRQLIAERDTSRAELRNSINNFVEKVERLAEEKMLKTGKLEGAHYAAMKQLQKEMEAAK